MSPTPCIYNKNGTAWASVIDKTGNGRSEGRWKQRWALGSGADLRKNNGQKLSEYRVSLTERKKEKSLFLTVSGSVGRRPFWNAQLCNLQGHMDSM